MSFISVKDKFTRRTAKSLKDMLRNHGIDSPKCVIFTTTISETLAVKDMILDVSTRNESYNIKIEIECTTRR